MRFLDDRTIRVKTEESDRDVECHLYYLAYMENNFKGGMQAKGI